MNKITVDKIDTAMATLRSLRTTVAALEGVQKKFEDAQGGYMAAKAGAREAMEADDFDKLTGFNLAMKRQHKLMEDFRDRKTDLNYTAERLMAAMSTWQDTQAAHLEYTEQPDIEKAA